MHCLLIRSLRTAFLLLLGAGLPAVAAPFLETVEVFAPGVDGINRHRIPGIVVTPRGTVLAYAEARLHSGSDWGEIEVRLRRSTNGGRTWAASQHVAHRGPRIEGNPHKARGGEREQTVNNPVAIVDQVTGAIEFLYCVNYARCFSLRSTNDGLSWSEPIEITAAFDPFRKKYDWKCIATGPGHGIQLRTGRLVVPIWLAYGPVGAHAPSAAATIYSDDHGRTWQAGAIALPNEAPFRDPNETTAAELSDGRVLLISRSPSQPNRKLVTTSPDGARDWTRPVFHDELWEPVCMASVVAHPAAPGLLLFSNPRTLPRDKEGKPVTGGRGKRENLSIRLSRDDGKTWPVAKTLEPGPSAYSDLAVLPDKTVLCLYEVGISIRCARFNLEWVTAP